MCALMNNGSGSMNSVRSAENTANLPMYVAQKVNVGGVRPRTTIFDQELLHPRLKRVLLPNYKQLQRTCLKFVAVLSRYGAGSASFLVTTMMF
jgi:hypothetical protein